jgi:hypothetical protein
MVRAFMLLVPLAAGVGIYYYNRPTHDVDRKAYGIVNPHIVCPHCLRIGHVMLRRIHKKAEMGEAKAAAVSSAGGISLLETRSLQKERSTEARCSRCESMWTY